MAAKAAQLTGLVLAGGFGRRLGGIDKGWVQYRGRPLIESVVERFAPQRARTDWIAIVHCDAPHLPADLVERLAGAADAACARVEGRLQPVFALVRRSTSASLQHHFAKGERALHAWLNSLAAVAVDFDDDAAFRNVNSAEDAEGRAA